jgi:NAD(P)-dependent dehydrogenase (short-subunit alcohol dehydrogenase family)
MTDLTGMGVLVTGAASGIGRASALAFAAAGARVVAADVDESGLATLAGASGGRIVPLGWGARPAAGRTAQDGPGWTGRSSHTRSRRAMPSISIPGG